MDTDLLNDVNIMKVKGNQEDIDPIALIDNTNSERFLMAKIHPKNFVVLVSILP